MDNNTLLRNYLSTVYELPTQSGPVRTSLDGDIVTDPSTLPELLTRPFAILTALQTRAHALAAQSERRASPRPARFS